MNSDKRFYQSKTFVFNSLVVVMTMAGYYYNRENVSLENIEYMAALFTASVNIALRFLTNQPIK